MSVAEYEARLYFVAMLGLFVAVVAFAVLADWALRKGERVERALRARERALDRLAGELEVAQENGAHLLAALHQRSDETLTEHVETLPIPVPLITRDPSATIEVPTIQSHNGWAGSGAT